MLSVCYKLDIIWGPGLPLHFYFPPLHPFHLMPWSDVFLTFLYPGCPFHSQEHCQAGRFASFVVCPWALCLGDAVLSGSVTWALQTHHSLLPLWLGPCSSPFPPSTFGSQQGLSLREGANPPSLHGRFMLRHSYHQGFVSSSRNSSDPIVLYWPFVKSLNSICLGWNPFNDWTWTI